jgi:putative aldouronate transport system permease protein
MEPANEPKESIPQRRAGSSFISKLIKQRELVFMSVPFLLLLILLRYGPIWGWIMAFKEYKPYLGLRDSPWVGFRQFKLLFEDEWFLTILRNTFAINFLELFCGFAAAIFLAVLISEVGNKPFRRIAQTISYLPHFISWTVAASLILTAFSTNHGIVNELLMALRIIKQPVLWFGEKKYFWGLMAITYVWKEAGWSAIIFIAAIANIDRTIYEAAEIDGASRLQRIFNVTLPSIMPTFTVLFVMSIGYVLTIGFEQVLLLQNSLVIRVAEIFQTYILRYGIGIARYSYATAAGIFNSLLSIVLVLIANALSKKFAGYRLF